MKNLYQARFLVLFLAHAAQGPAAETPAPAIGPCRGSGFVVIQVAANRDLLPKPDSNFEVYFDQNVFRNNSFEEALKRAADAWSGAGSNWRFQFKGYTDAAYDTDARMSLVRGASPIQLPSRVLAATLVSTSTRTGQIVDSDIFYNPGLPIDTYANSQEYDFELIALHEMGHALGLDHNDRCAATPTVMQSTVSPGSKERRLYQQEIGGVKYLYSGREAGVALSPLAISFLGVEGDAPPAPQTINLSGPAGTTWTAGVSAGPWLSISAGLGASRRS